MKLRDKRLLAEYMDLRGFSCARLGRYAGVSRQFVWSLVNDEHRTTCSTEVGKLIEEALQVLPGTLFVPSGSTVTRPSVAHTRTRRKTVGAGGVAALYLALISMFALVTAVAAGPLDMSIADLADYLGVPVKTIYRWREYGKGPRGYLVGKFVRFRQVEIDAWIEGRREAS
jgi:excisionase family DNA binding protein